MLNAALNLISFLSKVSWIRKRDLHILTVGILTYTNDQRFQSLHSEGSDEWTLRISSPQPRDSGTYECQVSTEPKISQGFRLNVVGEYAVYVCVCAWVCELLLCVLGCALWGSLLSKKAIICIVRFLQCRVLKFLAMRSCSSRAAATLISPAWLCSRRCHRRLSTGTKASGS